MKKNLYFLVAPLAVVFVASAQTVAGYDSQTSFNTQTILSDCGSCVTCATCAPFIGSEVVGTVGQVSGTVSPGSIAEAGTLSGTVNAQPTGGGGSGGGSVVPTTDQYGTGGGSFPTATVTLPTASTSTGTIPNMPNTGLGDEMFSYALLFLALLALFELPKVFRKVTLERKSEGN